MTPRRILPTLTVGIAALVILACEHEADGPGSDDAPPGIISAVGWDATHVVMVFDEPVAREFADNANNFQVSQEANRAVRTDGALGPTTVQASSLHSDNRTVTLTTDTMLPTTYMVTVANATDTRGNRSRKVLDRHFDGTDAADTTPPEVAYRLPAPGASAVPTGTFVLVGFTEPVNAGPFIRGFRVDGEGARLSSIRSDDALRYACDLDILQPNASYTISLTGVEDLAGNKMSATQWTFQTREFFDTSPPTVVRSRPANLAVNVDVATDLSFTFSEPVDPYSIILRPSVHANSRRWSNGGRTVTFETAWQPETQYTVQIRPGEMWDQAGNASRELVSVTFSTGGALAQGSFSGTITGDPNSVAASNPGGGLVFAGRAVPQNVYTSGAAMVSGNGAYTVSQLLAGTYYPFYVMDSNGDHLYQPDYGDAVGIYGVTDWQLAQTPGSIDVGSAEVTGVDFGLYDPTAVFGFINYDGIRDGEIHVGLFDPQGFDPATSVPVVAIIAEWTGAWDYLINSLEIGLVPAGSYYLAAYLDADKSGVYDPANDPFGIYGGASPIAVDLSNGKDARDASFVLNDPAPVANAHAVVWPETPRSRQLTSFLSAMLAAQP